MRVEGKIADVVNSGDHSGDARDVAGARVAEDSLAEDGLQKNNPAEAA